MKPVAAAAKSEGAYLVNTAKNCIIIMLPGAPSHVDTFDLNVNVACAEIRPHQIPGHDA